MNWSLIFKTAWRDSRKDRWKLFLFVSSIILGVASLVAINSFNDNLVKDIDSQSKQLLGADMKISSNRVISDDILSQVDSLGLEKASEIELFSMSYLPQQETSQFIKIKSIEGGFPYYGKLISEPSNASLDFKTKNVALVDDGMMLQYSITVGDSIRIGDAMIPIAGKLMNAFGSIEAGSSFAPTVYVNRDVVDKSNLVQPGSLVDYTFYYKNNSNVDLNAWKDTKRRNFRENSVRITTLDDQKENLDEAFSNLNNFLNIVALISLLLACIGVASSVMIYVKTKKQNIAILRCLGMKGGESFMVYFVQIMGLGAFSVLIGAIMGSGIQLLLPIVLKSFLPYEVNMTVSIPSFILGLVIGLVMTSLFALLPLLTVRKITPLTALRVTDEKSSSDPWTYVIIVLICFTIFGFFFMLSKDAIQAMFFTLAILIAFGILFLLSKVVIWSVRKFFPSSAPFVLRQGLSNLYRPNNQTQTLIISIGLGTSILTLLFILQGLILANVEGMGSGNQPNMVLFGIENDQKEQVEEITKEYDLPVLQNVPVVTMDLAGWQGKTKKEWLADTTRTARRWAINREARVSYTEEMPEDDVLLEGEYTGVHQGDSIRISLDERYARNMDVSIGDEMVWNVQGTMITTYVGSIRKISFRKMGTRFFILFPLDVLEPAPQFRILVTKSPDKNTTAAYRNAVAKDLPNVSIIDLESILATLNDIISKVSYVIKFMAGFSIFIGIIVLISSLFLSKYQRIRESVLMRTIGAVKRKIFIINAVEYFTLGALASLTGILLAVVGSFLLAKYVFELDFVLNWLPVVGIFLFVTLLTVAIGLWNSREVVSKSPLEILRNV